MEAVAGLKSSNISQFARAVNKSHEGMRELNEKIAREMIFKK